MTAEEAAGRWPWLAPVLLAEGPLRWLYALLIATLLAGIGEVLLRRALVWLREIAARTPTRSDDHLVEKSRLPTQVLVAAGACHLAALYAGIGWLAEGLLVAEWLLGTFLLVETADTLIVELVLEDRLKIRVPPLVRQVIIGMVYTGVLLGALGHVSGMDITPLLATTSVASLVLGLALQQPLSNLFAGLVLHVDRPFQEGDWVIVGQRDGKVEDIGWRSTRLRTLSNDLLILPNNLLMAAEIQNLSAPDPVTGRAIPLAVSPRVPPRDLERWLAEILPEIEGVHHDRPARAWLVRLDPTAHHYLLRVWVEAYHHHDEVESEILKRLWYRLRDEGYPLALETPIRLVGGQIAEGADPGGRAGPG